MRKSFLFFFVCSSCSLFAQETMKVKMKPLIEAHVKLEPLYRNCVVSDVVITNISIIDEKEKNKSLYDFYRAYRIKQIDQLTFIKGQADFIEQHCIDNKELFNKYLNQITSTLRETVPVIDSIWLIEDQYKTTVANPPAAEYYLVTFNFIYTLNGSKVTEKGHHILFNGEFGVIHHDFLNR